MSGLQRNLMCELLRTAIEQNKIPRYLYKYTTVDNALKAITRGTVYFARFSEFNDEYEGYAKIETDNNYDDWVDFLKKNRVYGLDALFIMSTVKSNPLKVGDIIKNVILECQKNNGFLCLTTKCNNVLMWAHYADHNKGCCLEYDLLADVDVFCRIQKIRYDDKTLEFNYLKNNGGAFEAMFHKSKMWEYEDEYRVLSIDEHGPKKVKDGSLTRIIFGTKTSEEDKKRIIDNINSLKHTPKISIAVKGSNASEFEIEDIKDDIMK